jgi:riboflavin synthase
MFTGIIQAVGRIAAAEARGSDVRFMFEARPLDLSDVAIGDSIAVNGVCLTVVSEAHYGFAADLSPETLARTGFARARVGDAVNLEKSLRLSDRLGGHLVSGHVDGLGTGRRDRTRAGRAAMALPSAVRADALHRREGLDRGGRV